MIDFRYHLVSIVAVFLALAIGILLGSTALKPTVLSGLERTSAAEKKTIDNLYANSRQQRQQISSDQSFAQGVEPQLLAHLLAGERVVIVTAPGAPGGVTSGIVTAVQHADATVSGQVQLSSRFFDSSPATQSVLSQLAQQYAPQGLTLREGSAAGQASQLLASAILTKGGPHQPVPGRADSAANKILAGLGAGGFLTRSGQPGARATLAVVVSPANPPSVTDSNAASQALVTVAQQLNLAGQGTVVAGSVNGSGPGSAIDVMRAGGRGGHLSSVDDAEVVIGQIVVAQALYEQLRGVAGSYGVGPQANGPGPSPAPTPTPTASAPASGRQHPLSAVSRHPRATASPTVQP